MPKKRTTLYAMVPQDFAHHPPVRQLTALEFAILAGLLTAARNEIEEVRHEIALEGGKQNIEQQEAYRSRFDAEWKEVKRRRRAGESPATAQAPVPAHAYARSHPFYDETWKGRFRPDSRRKSFRLAGRSGYVETKKTLRKQSLPPKLTFEISRSQILKAARLSVRGKTLAKLDDALIRLRNPIRIAGEEWPAVLSGYRVTTDGTLRLTIATSWLQSQFRKIPMPLPTRSRNAIALLLFLSTIKTGSSGERGIRMDRLFDRLGFPRKQPRSASIKALTRALDVVNAMLKSLDARELEEHGVKAPFAYEAIEKQGFIRFRHVPWQSGWRGEPINTLKPKRKQKPPPKPDKREQPVETPYELERRQKLEDIEKRKRLCDLAAQGDLGAIRALKLNTADE